MTMKTAIKNIWVLGGVLAASAVAGCQNSQQKSYVREDDYVPNPTLERQVPRFAEMQAAVGARQDGQLVPAHFSGDTLNSLGRQKLDLMLRDSDAAPEKTVYLNLPKAQLDSFDKRRDSVVAYLKDSGLTEAQIKVEHGPNHGVDYPAAAGIRGEHALEAASTAAPAAPSASMTK